MIRAVSIDNDNPGFLNPGFSRLKNNACLVLTEPYGVQACGPGGYCAILRENTIRSIRNEPQIFSPPAELSACYARGCAGNADELRSIAIIHRKGREERKAEVEKSLRPLRSLRLIDLHEIPMAQGNYAIGVFQIGYTGLTGCVLSFDPVMWSRMEKPQIHSPPAELSACYARGRAVTGSRYQTERRYIEPPYAFIYVHPRLITIIHHSMEVCT